MYRPAPQVAVRLLIAFSLGFAAPGLGAGDVAVKPGPGAKQELTDRWTPAGLLTDPRRGHTSTLLPSGKVLVAGGELNNATLTSAELYDPLTREWHPTGSMTVGRRNHTATLLPTGQVLVVGGDTTRISGVTTASAELYDPATGEWRPADPLGEARHWHTATLLPSGRVLVAGGQANPDVELATTELYDPASGMWSPAGEMPDARAWHTATLLPSGKVLVAGGWKNGRALDSVVIFDPATGWTTTTALHAARARHAAILLPSREVLVAGGLDDDDNLLDAAEIYDPVTGTWTPTTSMSDPRAVYTATLLPSGRVLVAGGGNVLQGGDAQEVFLDTAEIYDPVSHSWSPAGKLANALRTHTATLLASGDLLVAGGTNVVGAVAETEVFSRQEAGRFVPTTPLHHPRVLHSAVLLASGDLKGQVLVGGLSGQPAELYDPVTETSTLQDSALASFDAATSTLLPSGRVLVCGGGRGNGGEPFNVFLYLATVEPRGECQLFDPNTGESSPTGSLHQPRLFHTATLLPSGKVLIAGGFQSLDTTLDSVELYDPATGEWQEAAELGTARFFHTATLLPSGQVLVVGGLEDDQRLNTAELYDPAADVWTPTDSLGYTPFLHTATLLPSGKVLVVGGSTTDAELYDPTTESWSAAGRPHTGRLGHTATLLASGRVLVTGGTPDEQAPATAGAELYDPTSDSWYPAPDLTEPRVFHTATLLASDGVLLSGGAQGSLLAGFLPSDRTETYRPESHADERRPVILENSEEIRYGEPLTITGSRFAGPWEASQGTTGNSAANFPVVELRNLESGLSARVPYDSLTSFADDPLTLTVSRFDSDPVLTPGWHFLSVSAAGVRSVSRLVEMKCGLEIAEHPRSQSTELGSTVTFSVDALGALSLQWQKDGVDIPGATGSTYTTTPIGRNDVGSVYTVVATSGCATETSRQAVVTVNDSVRPEVEINSPSGGEVWLLSDSDPAQPPEKELVTWTMEDDVRICKVRVWLFFSTDGGKSWKRAQSGGGLPFTAGSGAVCATPETTNRVEYTVPRTPPSGQPGSLYRIRVEVTDHAGNRRRVRSRQPFFIVTPNNETIKTLILTHPRRMREQMGITASEAEELVAKLRELAEHPQVRGRLVDLGGSESLNELYLAWDREDSSVERANEVLFGPGGIHEIVRRLLEAFTGVDSLLLVGDDRIVPMARIQDRTVLFLEENYASDDPADADAGLTTRTPVGRALAANRYLSDDPLAVREPVSPEDLETRGEIFLPDLAVGRLVETPEEILTSIATFFQQDGLLDLGTLDAGIGHKVLVSGYDFLVDSGRSVREHWKNVLGPAGADTLAPVDGELLSADWGEGSVEDRRLVFHEHLSGNGGEPYRILNPNGHATHHELGVPGIDRLDIQGLSTLDLYGEDLCGNVSRLGPIEMSGSVVYGVGCHGGLPVPGSCATDGEHSLDLPQTLLARGVAAYVANTGYGWGLLKGVGLSERLVQILTEELTSGATVEIGDAVRRSKQQYFQESPRFDEYDAKTVMQWTLFGFPMYQVATGLAEAPLRAEDSVLKVEGGPYALGELKASLPSFLTRLDLSLDVGAQGVYVKHTADGERVESDVEGCPASTEGCYYTLNGLSTGSADLPIEPFFVFDSRLSGTSQHGVLWKGGTYTQEEDWRPLVAELASNGGDGSNHGSTPRRVYIRPRGPRQRRSLGNGPGGCPATDEELNTVVFTTGEAVKKEESSEWLHVLHRQVALEVLYFNDTLDPVANCDRSGPILGGAPHHDVQGSTVSWAVQASDEAGVWRVVVVYTESTPEAPGEGDWIPLELEADGSGTWRGSLSVTGTSRITYYLQAVDRRGNVSWLEYETPASGAEPASGVELGIPLAVEVVLGPP